MQESVPGSKESVWNVHANWIANDSSCASTPQRVPFMGMMVSSALVSGIVCSDDSVGMTGAHKHA